LVSELIELGERYSIIEKRGAFISYNDTRLGQGAANAKQYLIDHPDILEEIKTKIMQASAAESPFENGSAQIEKEDDDE
jgi:recombination protein RecA